MVPKGHERKLNICLRVQKISERPKQDIFLTNICMTNSVYVGSVYDGPLMEFREGVKEQLFL